MGASDAACLGLVRLRRSDQVEGDEAGAILKDAVHPSSVPLVPEAWSVQRVADLLHVSESTVRRLTAAGAFPHAFRVGRKLVRIPITDLDAYQRRARLLAHVEDRTAWPTSDPVPNQRSA